MHDPSPYYEARRRDFESRVQAAGSESLKALLHRALAGTAETAQSFVALGELAKLLTGPVKKQMEDSVASTHTSVENAKELLANLLRITKDPAFDPDLKRISAVLTQNALLSTRSLLEAKQAEINLFVDGFGIVMSLLVDSLALRIYKPDASDFELDAVCEGILFAIDSIPLFGSFTSTIRTIRSLVVARRQRFETADSYNLYLEGYIRACEIWCKATSEIIRVYEEFIATDRGSVRPNPPLEPTPKVGDV